MRHHVLLIATQPKLTPHTTYCFTATRYAANTLTLLRAVENPAGFLKHPAPHLATGPYVRTILTTCMQERLYGFYGVIALTSYSINQKFTQARKCSKDILNI